MAEKSIFARRLSREEQNKLARGVFVGCIVISFNLCMFLILLKPYLRLPTICEIILQYFTTLPSILCVVQYFYPIFLRSPYLFYRQDEVCFKVFYSLGKSTKGVRTNAVGDMLIANKTTGNYSEKSVGSSATLNNATQDILTANHSKRTTQLNIPQIETTKIQPLCRVLNAKADYCEMEGDIRVDSTSSTVFLIRPRAAISLSNITSWIIQPYPTRGITQTKKWTVTLAADDDENIPKCSKNHTLPALLFSIGGFSGNLFHDFSDLIIPLFTTSFQFKREVHLLASDYRPFWPTKFHRIIGRLTKHGLLDIDREKDVNCYNKMIAGLQFHKDLIIDPSSDTSMNQFRRLIRETYSLKRTTAIRQKKSTRIQPRLMIISRKRTRVTTNEDEVARVASELGYEVVLATEDMSANLTEFAQLVNSCDVMMGVHGAGLTNMVFLPDSAVLIQVVPLGAIDWYAETDFENPAPGMNIRYLKYKIEIKESSLIQQYPANHPVIRDPSFVEKNGWGQLKAVYLDNQNVTIDIYRFKGTLAKALKLLCH